MPVLENFVGIFLWVSENSDLLVSEAGLHPGFGIKSLLVVIKIKKDGGEEIEERPVLFNPSVIVGPGGDRDSGVAHLNPGHCIPLPFTNDQAPTRFDGVNQLLPE